MRLAVIHSMARLGIAFAWLWQGLVPKLLFSSVDEHAMMTAARLPIQWLPAIGVVELAFALATLVLWRWRTLFLWNLLAMVAALLAVVVQSPAYLKTAFNPVTLNLGLATLSIVGYFAATELPSASRCLRRAPGGKQ